jgi:hypothetical protein
VAACLQAAAHQAAAAAKVNGLEDKNSAIRSFHHLFFFFLLYQHDFAKE